jgi:hypothetical protein
MSGIGTAAVTAVTRTQPPVLNGVPAKVDLVRIVRGPGDTHIFAAPLVLTANQLSQLNSLNQTEPGYQDWFTSHGAVDADRSDIEIVLEGNRSHTVRIVGIQPVTACSAPLRGTLFFSPSAGNDTSTQLFVNLDAPNTLPSYITSEQNGNIASGKDFFGTYTVSLTQGEQYTFKVVASTKAHYCSFTLDMTVLDGNQSVVEHIDDNGKPFHVSSMIDPNPTAPGEMSAYSVLYIGGVANFNGGQNTFGDDLWTPADPSTYSQ